MDKAKVIASYILAGGIIFASGCGETKNKLDSTKEVKSNTKVTKVETETLTPAIFKKQIRVQGTIKPINKASISARIGGIIDSLNVKEGDYVQKGDLLFQTDKTNLENAVISAQKLYDVSSKIQAYTNSDIPVAVANKNKVELDYNRDKGLFKNGAISRSDFEGTEVSYKSALAGVQKAEALTKATNSLSEQLATSLKIAEKNLADSKIYAPYNGYIIAKKMNEGEFAMPGMTVLEIENTNELEIVCRISAVYYDSITENTTLEIEYSGKKLADVPITYKAPNIDSLTRTFEIKALVPAGNGIISGLLCDVNMVLEQHEGLGINNKAIISQKNGRNIIFLIDSEKAIEKVIEKGLTTGDKTEILNSDDLKGRQIIVKGNYYLNDGAPIEIMSDGGRK